MLFNIERDEGRCIVGYMVPDTFSRSCSLRVTDGDKELLILQCREERAALVAAGRHETGRCGFAIDDTMIADLAELQTIEIYDQETGLLIYRRRPPDQLIQKRIFRLETHLVPLWRLDDRLERHFQFFHKGIERHGLETTTQMFLLNYSSSLYLAGRIPFKAFENYIDETFTCTTLFRDPYTELAERLLTLGIVRKVADKVQLLGARDMMSYGPALDFSEQIKVDSKVLHRAFAAMPKAAIAILSNPLTRLLAARRADEVPGKGAVATALGTLSRFASVGLREGEDLFLAQLAAMLGIDAASLPATADFSKTLELSALLREVPEVQLLIEKDLDVYHHTKSAIEKALAEQADAAAS